MDLPAEIDHACPSRRRAVWIAVTCPLLVVALVGILVFVKLAYCPISAVIKDLTPAQMVDGEGKRMWQLTLVVTNSERLQFEPGWVVIEAKGPCGWVEADGHCALPPYGPGYSELIFVVPTEASHFRIRLGYQREMLKWRVWEKLGQRGRTTVTKYAPGISARFWPRTRTSTFNTPPLWKHTVVVFQLPPQVSLEPL